MLVAEKKITVEDFLKMEFEGEDAYYELINGHIVKKSSPTPLHQEISQNLNILMDGFVRKKQLDKVYVTPTDVFLNKHSHVIPDILFIKKENLQIVDYKNGILGVPDLIVEIISPSSVLIDREDKKLVYENAGVKEYWLIDPRYRTIEIYENKNGRFKVVSSAVDEGKVQSVLLEGFEAEIKELFPVQ